MKKIRLNVANLNGTEILSREQLKSVFGGGASGASGSDTCTAGLTGTRFSNGVCYCDFVDENCNYTCDKVCSNDHCGEP